MTRYLTTLITEKGRDVEDTINIDGHIGLTYKMLIDFIAGMPDSMIKDIRKMLVKIDFLNGDVFHYLTYLAKGMVKSLGH